MLNKIYLSVIIPAYNEERRLPKTLEEINEYLIKQDYGYEIIAVSDGSTDKTAEMVKNLIPEIKCLKLINNKENHGKGYAVRQGMVIAQGEYRLFTDADNSTSIDQIERMWPCFKEGYDIVIGSRDVEGAVLTPPQPFYRRLLGRGFRLLTQITCGTWEILDTQCGFKGFKAEAVKDIFPRCRINHFAFDPEILMIAKKLGYKIREVPVTWENDPESKVKFKSIIKMALDLLKIRYGFITGEYAKKI